MPVDTGAKLVNALRLRGCPSEGVPGENSAYNNTDSVKLYKWELPAATVLAVEMDKESGEEHPILRTADAIVGFVSEVERITFNDEDRRRGKAQILTSTGAIFHTSMCLTPCNAYCVPLS